MDSLDKLPKLRNIYVIFDTWNMKTLYRTGLLITVSGIIFKYKLGLMRVQEVRWNRGGTESTGECLFFYVQGNGNCELGTYLNRRNLHEKLRL
jgi:hypothetical protein